MAAEYADGKDDGALRTIGEVSRAVGVKTHVLRYWEQQFPMLQPLKRSGSRRYYRPEDVALIERIDALVNRQGYTLKGALQVLGGDGNRGEPSGGEADDIPPATPGDPSEQGGTDVFLKRDDDADVSAPAPFTDEGTTFRAGDGLSRAAIRERLQAMRDRLAAAIAA